MKNIYMVQPNSQYGNSVYFPYAAGSLVAYAFEDDRIKKEYTFKGFIYKRLSIEKALDFFEDPFFVGFSCYVWNYEYNKALAKALKKVYPDCYIAFGGHQITADSEVAYGDYADFCLLGEGEDSFTNLLLSLAGCEQIENVSNLVYRRGNQVIRTDSVVSEIPNRVSPYLKGYFDELVKNETLEFSAIIETTRGCPNRCAFCDWGNIKAKVRSFDLDMVKAEIDWMSEHKIEYCFCADANFGLFPRDGDIVKYVIKKNEETGYPQKFQASYSKTNSETVYTINKMLNDAGMSKGATLSFQSMDQTVLNNIYRKNMPIENFHKLMSMYNSNGIAAYSEIILGLPGETYNSFRNGIEQLLECGQHMAINFFNCEILGNSIMGSPEYMKKYDIQYAVTEQHQYHVIPNNQEIPEYSKIVVSTSSMTREDWIACNILHVFVRAFHNLGLLQCIAIYLFFEKQVKYTDFYSDLINWAKANRDSICGSVFYWLDGKYREILDNRGSLTCYDPDFGELTWPLEEGSFLKIIKKYEEFYSEIVQFLEKYFDGDDLFDQLLSYQKAVVKNPYNKRLILSLDFDFYSYFTGIYSDSYKPLEKKKNTLEFDLSDISSNLPEFAKNTIWFGRKGGQNIVSKIKYIS